MEKSILSTVKRFENINKEIKRLNIISEMLWYYINIKKFNKKNLKLLDDNEIKELMKIYDNNDNDLSLNSISSTLEINTQDKNNDKLSYPHNNNLNEIIEENQINKNNSNELDNGSSNDESENDELEEIANDINNLDINNNKDLNFYLIENLKNIDLSNIN